MEDIYGSHGARMELVLDRLVDYVKQMRVTLADEEGFNPIEHVLARVKSPESMRDKCRRRGLPETTEAALGRMDCPGGRIYDALGVRVVCAFLSDVYALRNHLTRAPGFAVVEERDYIRSAKPNGYRSYHMILRSEEGYFAEVQLRTISMDTWAALEHHLQYKKAYTGNRRLIAQELKRCADELASTDVSMQTLRDMILGEEA